MSYYAMQNMASVFSEAVVQKNLPIMVKPQRSAVTGSDEPDGDEIMQCGFRIGDSEVYAYWKSTNLMTTDYEGTFSISSALMKEVHLVDLMDGSIYRLPETMVEEGDYPYICGCSIVGEKLFDKNAYTYSNLPIKDYPMVLIFGDISKFM